MQSPYFPPGPERKWFVLRLVIAYLTVPLAGSASMLSGPMTMIYALFSFLGMVALGLPLLFLYAWLNWNGFLAFSAGGAVCAAATYVFMAREHSDGGQLAFFSLVGLIEGVLFRLILFGVRLPRPSIPAD